MDNRLHQLLSACEDDGAFRDVLVGGGVSILLQLAETLIGLGWNLSAPASRSRARAGESDTLSQLRDDLKHLDEGTSHLVAFDKAGITAIAYVDGDANGEHSFRELDFAPREVKKENVGDVVELLLALSEAVDRTVELIAGAPSSALASFSPSGAWAVHTDAVADHIASVASIPAQPALPQPELIPFLKRWLSLMRERAEEVDADRSNALESGRRMGWYEVLSSLKNHCVAFDFPLSELALDTYDPEVLTGLRPRHSSSTVPASASMRSTPERSDDDEVKLPLPKLVPFLEDRMYLMRDSAEEANAGVTDDFEAGRGLAYREALALTRELCAALGVPLRERAEQ